MKRLPRWAAIVVWCAGFALVLAGEAIALGTPVEGDTITEVTRWLIGVGEGYAWYHMVLRIALFGTLGWLLLHFSGREV